MIETVNWDRVARAVSFYEGQGFTYVETPWVVSLVATKATFPVTEENPEPLGLTSGDVPVGSAEQGFIQLMLQGELRPGRYVSAGPCFRPQDAGKPYHQAQFFKVELIQLVTKGAETRGDLVKIAHQFFLLERPADRLISFPTRKSPKSHGLVIVPTNDGCDLELNGLEIGSYGVRTFRDFTWEYGTGLAEPRFTQATEKTK